MTCALPSSSRRLAVSAIAWTLLAGLGACAEDPGDPISAPPAQNPIVVDGQVALPSVGNDAGVARLDGSTTPVPGIDAQVSPGVDAQQVGSGSDARVATEGGNVVDTGLADGGGSTAHVDQGKGTGKDVITIGDSWMLLLGTGIQESLVKVAMQPYRKYGFPGTQVVNGDIPAQFDTAKRADPVIKTVVMTGGGNDILLTGSGADCETGGPNCTAQLDKIATTLDTLWKKMADSGVQDVVHVQYAAIAVKKNPVKNLPAHLVRLQQMCSSHPPMRCYQMNTDAIVTELRSDGIHPTDPNYDKLGKAVFDLMVSEGMRR